MQFSRILVRATNWVGDAVMSIPALQALRERFPLARISILARSWVAGLYGREPFCDELIHRTEMRQPFYCVTPEETAQSHHIFTAALESQRKAQVIDLERL